MIKYLPEEKIEESAIKILKSERALNIPVRVDVLAHRLDINVEYVPLGDDVSGLLIIEDGVATIGVNKEHTEVRQRYTIAHEIGHYILHAKNSSSGLFIDKSYIAARDSRSSSGADREEIQANMFAASLLMPKDLLEAEIYQRKLDLADDESLSELADKFKVSLQAMAYRIANLLDRD